MEELKQKLREVGLSERESQVYIELARKGPIGGGKLSKILQIDRTHTYNILKNLVNKGFASYIVKDKKTLFQTTSPDNLLNSIKKKENIIKSLIPDIKALGKTPIKESHVEILEGKAGIKTILQKLIESKPKEICVYGGTGKSYEILKYEIQHITKSLKTQKFTGRIITGEKLKGELFTKLSNFKIKYVKELTPSSTMIFGDKVSINIFDEKPFFILIENKSLATSYKNYFEYLWKQAED